MQLLTKRFERHEQFYNQYKCFIDKLIHNENARKCDSAGPERRPWYVLHQGLLNPNKYKIRVAFECSSQSTSINEKQYYMALILPIN